MWWAVIVAVIVFAGIFYFVQNHPGAANQATSGSESPQGPSSGSASTTAPATSNINNYDDCMAQGGKQLPGTPPKCLTPDGYVFIQGVTE